MKDESHLGKSAALIMVDPVPNLMWIFMLQFLE